MQSINDIIIKSIFKKYKIDLLILNQKDVVEYDSDHEDWFVESDLQNQYLGVSSKDNNVRNLNLNVDSKEYLPEKVYNFAVLQSITNPILTEVFNKKAIDYIQEFWQNNQPKSRSDNWLLGVDEEVGSVGFQTSNHWCFLFVENDKINIKFCQNINNDLSQTDFSKTLMETKEQSITEEDLINNPAWKLII
jgi:hypothetical protein